MLTRAFIQAASVDTAAEVYCALMVTTYNDSLGVFIMMILADAALTHKLTLLFLNFQEDNYLKLCFSL